MCLKIVLENGLKMAMLRVFLLVSVLFVLGAVFMECKDVTVISDKHKTPMSISNAISDIAEKVIFQLGWDKEDVKVSTIDISDAKIGQTLTYEFDIEVEGAVLPLRLSEEIKTWKFVQELPASKKEAGEDGKEGDNTLVELLHPEAKEAVLEPFQVAGPVELWIQDSKQMRLALPHDVEAGVLKRVLLAEGAVVTVAGAHELSLTRPLQLPLPLVGQAYEGRLASSLYNLASRLRYASLSQGQPLLSLRVVGPTSLVAATTSVTSTHSEGTAGTLKVKRLAPGSVELVATHQDERVSSEAMELLQGSMSGDSWIWPLPSINTSDAKLISLEKALKASLGPIAYRKGSFRLLRARASAASLLKINFELERALSKEAFDEDTWPDWATKPTVQRVEFEVLAKLEGAKVLPVNARQVYPHAPGFAISIASNTTLKKTPPFLPPIRPMTLDLDWGGMMD